MRYFNLTRIIKNWRIFFAYKLGFKHDDPMLLYSRTGVKIQIPLRLLHTFKEIFLETCYIHGLNKLYHIPENPVVIDIGANGGLFSLFAAACFGRPKVFAYEPIPFNYEQLKRNASLNNSFDIKTFQMAVAKQGGPMEMIYEGPQSFTTTAHISRDGMPKSDKNNLIEVICTTLESILKENHIEHCDFLKLDCEGAESDILLNCSDECLSKISVMAIEIHGDAVILIDYLKKKNFRTFETKRASGMLWAFR